MVATLAIAGIGILVARSLPSHEPSPIWVRLVVAVIVTVFAAAAKVLVGPRAAALAGVVGVLVAVVLLIAVAWISPLGPRVRAGRRASRPG